MSSNKYREALKKILEIRSREKGVRVSRSIEDSRRIGLLAQKCFEESYEVVVWGREKRIIKMKKFLC